MKVDYIPGAHNFNSAVSDTSIVVFCVSCGYIAYSTEIHLEGLNETQNRFDGEWCQFQMVADILENEGTG